jgi:hypothetical protein
MLLAAVPKLRATASMRLAAIDAAAVRSGVGAGRDPIFVALILEALGLAGISHPEFLPKNYT